jgi:glycosyltransferase involved in cell wall biosynthesis
MALISICIPAYKNVHFISRLLDSIAIQTFDDYEVIVTDDSPDNTVSKFVEGYSSIKSLRYFKNEVPLGTPENWNESIRYAKGEWIKIMHDDDWFSRKDSLSKFARAIGEQPGIDFFYSRYITVDEKGGKKTSVKPSIFRRSQLKKNPSTLISANIIGPPSAVIYRADANIAFNKNLKWLVDIEFYYRYLNDHMSGYIDESLVNIGINEMQVTRQSSLVREVEIPEYFLFFQTAGFQNIENVLVYDAWWRLFRNLNLKNEEEIFATGYSGKIPAVLKGMLRFQRRFPRRMLSNGIISKLLMSTHFLASKND